MPWSTPYISLTLLKESRFHTVPAKTRGNGGVILAGSQLLPRHNTKLHRAEVPRQPKLDSEPLNLDHLESAVHEEKDADLTHFGSGWIHQHPAATRGVSRSSDLRGGDVVACSSLLLRLPCCIRFSRTLGPLNDTAPRISPASQRIIQLFYSGPASNSQFPISLPFPSFRHEPNAPTANRFQTTYHSNLHQLSTPPKCLAIS